MLIIGAIVNAIWTYLRNNYAKISEFVRVRLNRSYQITIPRTSANNIAYQIFNDVEKFMDDHITLITPKIKNVRYESDHLQKDDQTTYEILFEGEKYLFTKRFSGIKDKLPINVITIQNERGIAFLEKFVKRIGDDATKTRKLNRT